MIALRFICARLLERGALRCQEAPPARSGFYGRKKGRSKSNGGIAFDELLATHASGRTVRATLRVGEGIMAILVFACSSPELDAIDDLGCGCVRATRMRSVKDPSDKQRFTRRVRGT